MISNVVLLKNCYAHSLQLSLLLRAKFIKFEKWVFSLTSTGRIFYQQIAITRYVLYSTDSRFSGEINTKIVRA